MKEYPSVMDTKKDDRWRVVYTKLTHPQADAIEEIARREDAPNAKILRRAVEEYLAGGPQIVLDRERQRHTDATDRSALKFAAVTAGDKELARAGLQLLAQAHENPEARAVLLALARASTPPPKRRAGRAKGSTSDGGTE